MVVESINHLPVVNSKEVLIEFIAFHELAAHLSPEHLLIDLYVAQTKVTHVLP